ncbi:hypothetical protein MHBO_000233 [Bonamia ostreae]|uniref:Uncharacterized protein n=1 Tax=Bonamia ostreae TaxID=126728 RepID=A0ABV2AFK6_9EUKA
MDKDSRAEVVEKQLMRWNKILEDGTKLHFFLNFANDLRQLVDSNKCGSDIFDINILSTCVDKIIIDNLSDDNSRKSSDWSAIEESIDNFQKEKCDVLEEWTEKINLLEGDFQNTSKFSAFNKV